jgi:hypothetical protein
VSTFSGELQEWYDEIRGFKTPEGLHRTMGAAVREAVDRAADEDNTSIEALIRLKARMGEEPWLGWNHDQP